MRYWKHVKRALGPGLITGASDDDPSGIATYTQAGAFGGLSFLWTSLFTLPFMVAIEELCARIAIVTGRGLVRNLKERYSRPVVSVLVVLLLVANVINIGADLGMMAVSASLVMKLPFIIWLVFFALLTLALEIFLHYGMYATYLKWLTLSLFAYVIVGFGIHVSWSEVLRATVHPQLALNKESLMMFLAVLGTTISPYLFFWEAGQVLEEERLHKHLSGTKRKLTVNESTEAVADMRADVGIGMLFSNIVSWFIILTSGVVLYSTGIHSVSTPAEASQVLTPVLGSWAGTLFAIGVVGTGLLAIPVLSGSAAYAFSELVGAREGLNETWKTAHVFYGVIALAGVIGFALNFSRISPIDALIYSAVCNAVIAAPLVYVLNRLGADKKVMGRYASGWISRWWNWGVFVLMGGASLAWLFFQFQ